MLCGKKVCIPGDFIGEIEQIGSSPSSSFVGVLHLTVQGFGEESRSTESKSNGELSSSYIT